MPQSKTVVLLSILGLLPTLVRSSDQCTEYTGSDGCLAQSSVSSKLPLSCENFTVTQGDLNTASTFILGEHHDQEMETMQCLLELMNTLKTKKFNVFFEGQDILSKEQILSKINKLKEPGMFVDKLGQLIEEICIKATSCSSWDDSAEYHKMRVLFGYSIKALLIETKIVPYILKNPTHSKKNIIKNLQSMIHGHKKIDSHYDNALIKNKNEVIQEIINEYEKTNQKIDVILLNKLNQIKELISPHCDKTPVGKIAYCIREKSTDQSLFSKKRNNQFRKLVERAEKERRENTVTLFRAGKIHADAVREKGSRVVHLTHKRAHLGGR